MRSHDRGHAHRIVLGVFTQLLGPGGIPYAGRQAAAVLTVWAREMGFVCRILGLNDPVGAHDLELAGIDFVVEGFEGCKSRLFMQVLSVSPRVQLVYLGHCGLGPLGLKFWLLGTPYLIAGHGIEIWAPLGTLTKAALRGAAAITTPSVFTAEKVQQIHSVKREKIYLIPWGVPSALDAPSTIPGPQLPTLPAGKNILTVARLAASERYKGIDDVIRAMPALAREFPNLHYFVVGDGDDRFRLECLAADVAVANRVRFLGVRSDAEVASFYQACDAFVMPSRGEGFGLVYLEAMARGKPVVAAQEAATPEVVVDGETGILVDYGDVTGLASSISRILRDPSVGRKMGEAGRRRYQEHYTFKHFRDRFVDLMMTQIGVKRRSSVELVCNR